MFSRAEPDNHLLPESFWTQGLVHRDRGWLFGSELGSGVACLIGSRTHPQIIRLFPLPGPGQVMLFALSHSRYLRRWKMDIPHTPTTQQAVSEQHCRGKKQLECSSQSRNIPFHQVTLCHLHTYRHNFGASCLCA